MKFFLMPIVLLVVAMASAQQDSLKTRELDNVIVYATRADENTPVTYSEVSKKQIEEVNFGYDLPILLNLSPSVVTTSDAGAGVGYTGFRIRGSDATRINVTINGISLNDAESHAVFWVNMPDFASSVNTIQIQRGVGTSTNGTAAFGATVNLQTNVPSRKSFAEINNSFGSFNTRKHTVIYNTGILNDRWAFESRLSKIASDGYIDRASSDLQAYFLSGGYYGNKTILKALVFGGKEVTYQSWYGTPEAVLENDTDGIEKVITDNGYNDEQADNIRTAGKTFNYYLYENEVDNYQQDHYQLHLSHSLNTNLYLNVSGHYTYGRGYFEQYRDEDDFSDYGLQNVTIGDATIISSDFIRRKWLDNHFYGFTYSFHHTKDDLRLTLGGGWNEYNGDHFGEIIWAQYSSDSDIMERYYDNIGRKIDFNAYLKTNYQLNAQFNLFMDLQIRKLNYQANGLDNDRRAINVDEDYVFFNPKFGVTYALNENVNFYASYAVGNREPIRTDFTDALTNASPKHETLNNIEIGFRKYGKNFDLFANYYLMSYTDQLVLTGAVNDVGSSLRQNIPRSYRTGVEVTGKYKFSIKLQWEANLTLSRNKIRDFTEVFYNYGIDFNEFNIEENIYTNTDISFSPNVIGGSNFSYFPIKPLGISLRTKYVGRNFLDNTSNNDRKIDAYFVNDLLLNYGFSWKNIDRIKLNFLINNLLDVEYSSNGYTFGHAGGDYVVRENYYYPQAGRNFLVAVSMKL